MKTNQIVKNASLVSVQVVVSGITMFLLYRWLLMTIGVEQMGIWSLVLATTTASRITELGFTTGIVKFVAKYLALNDQAQASEVIQTALITLACFTGILLLLAYFPLRWLLKELLTESTYSQGVALLPYAMLCLWFTTQSGVVQSSLDACQRADLRVYFNIIYNVLLFVLSIITVNYEGLLGLAIAQSSMALLLLSLCWLYLRREISLLPCFPWSWNRKQFREIIGYGLSIQVSSLVQMLYDPMTKSLLSRFGGVGLVGYYEMSTRMIMQFRGLLTAPIQIMTPVIANLQETNPTQIKALYLRSFRFQAFLSIPLYATIVIFLPVISYVWIGHYQTTFIQCSMILALAWFLNGLNIPAYFFYQGIGNLHWNMLTHLVTGLLNAIIGLVMAMYFGGMGAVAGWGIALVLGSSIIIFTFHHEYGLQPFKIITQENIWQFMSAIICISLTIFFYDNFTGLANHFWPMAGFSGLLSTVIFIPFIIHPMRKELTNLLRRKQPFSS